MLAAIHWNADPVAFSVFGLIDIAWYGILFACAFFVAHTYMRAVYKREGRSIEDLDRFAMFAIFATVAGARLGHLLFYEDFSYYFIDHPIKIFYLREGGLASHGAAFMLLLTIWWWGRKKPNQSFLWMLDRIGMVILLGGAFIRIGNFINGEILGTVSELPWAVVFENAKDPELAAKARHPAQLYEAVVVLILFAVMHFTYKKKYKTWAVGRLGGLFLVLLFSSRLLIEFVKVEQATTPTGVPLNTGQLLSIPFILIGLWLLLRKTSSHEEPI